MDADEAMADFEQALSKSLNEGMAAYATEHGLPVMWWAYSAERDEWGVGRLRISGHLRNGDLGEGERAAVDAWGDHFGFGPGVADDSSYHREGSMHLMRSAVVDLWGVIDAEKWRTATGVSRWPRTES